MADWSSGGSGRSAVLCCNQVCRCSRRGMIIRNIAWEIIKVEPSSHRPKRSETAAAGEAI
jgi:hypothetical protein